MRVVLFCGGLGTRLRDYSEAIPKSMITVGYRPILWHVMKYYAHYGHSDFILCLGYKADVIKDFFLNYNEAVSNDFVLSHGGRDVRLLNRDIDDWTVTFVDTGLHSTIGERLLAVRSYLEGEEVFLANYSDGLTDLHLPSFLEGVSRQGKVGAFLAVKPPQSYHLASIDEESAVTGVDPISASDFWINGGYFVFRREIFDYLHRGEDLVVEGFDRLIRMRQLMAHKFTGFWLPMDTFKDKQRLDDLYAAGRAPWQVWKNGSPDAPAVVPVAAPPQMAPPRAAPLHGVPHETSAPEVIQLRVEA